ncbi:phospholipase D-like domain-containing protein [Streptomyces sp. NRRL S-118]|uniref:phospholipase D-like domain-containing protein n=1 Tax=Streptomyces sp. NRRL S-118 TaxID=1463881 RepID=UPI0004CC1614|nr:phosphatidylserine/phosphatidylglycerophosphate/cardiolipin synthase family protein [Streptomyces sp. NRRL S-118]
MKRRKARKAGLTLAAASMAVVSLSALSAAPATSVVPTRTVSPAAAAVPVGPHEVRDYTLFSTKVDAPDSHKNIADHARRLIDAASPGAMLSLTLYYFDRDEIVDALRRAAARGVSVRLVVDGYMVGNAWHKALTSIPGITVVACDPRRSGGEPVRACMGNRVIHKVPVMHNKFMIISSVQLTGGRTAKNVLYVSSANLDHYTAYESVLTLTHAGLYEDYLTYFNDLMRHGSTGQVNNDYGKTFRAGDHRIYTFPRKETGNKPRPRSASNDPIAGLLRNTACGSPGRTRIDLANFRIQRAAVVKELIAARERGCKVRVVTGEDQFVEVNRLARAMPVRLCSHDNGAGITMHEKFILVRRGSRSTLYVGSHNLTYRALRQNDESILALRNHPIGSSYLKRFDYLHEGCERMKPRKDVVADQEG